MLSAALERELQQKLQLSNERAAKAEIQLANSYGTVPPTCPFDGCKKYISDTVKDRVKAFKLHLKLQHQCKHCNAFVAAPKEVHMRYCKHNSDLTESDDEDVKKET
jgi:hypothetical protein